MKIRIPVLVKILTPLILVISLSVGISGYRIYQETTQRWQTDLDYRLEQSAEFLASAIDVEALQQVNEPTDVSNPAYLAVQQQLQQVVSAGNLSWAGIYRLEGEILHYWVDISDTGIGYPFFYVTPQHFAAFEDRQTHPVAYTDEFGSYYGFVAPIVVEGADGPQVIGLVETVFDGEAAQLLESQTLERVLPILLGGILLAFAAAALVTYFTFYHPLQRLKRGALELAGGHFGHTIPLRSHDEMGDLATAFNRMSTDLGRLYGELQEANRRLEERVQARTAELQEERNRLDTILQNIADGLVVTDPEGTVELANPAFTQIAGSSLQQLLGVPLARALPARELSAQVERALAHPGEVFSTTLDWQGGRGSARGPRVYKAAACALMPQEGETYAPLGVVTILRDITHETEVDRTKTDFISMVSHELRTPLTSILGFAKLTERAFEKSVVPLIPVEDAQGRQGRQRIRDNLGIIVGEGERLTRLVNDVLDIARMEAGKIEWHMGAVSLKPVIQSAVAATSALALEKQLYVVVHVEEGLPAVHADRDRLIQVMTNLLSNAVKFTDRGGIEVRARMVEIGPDSAPPLHGLEAGRWVAVSVQDSGIGIAAEDMPKVFEKFRQVGSAADRPRGTGLGLTICREIVEVHGGRIWIDSTPGEGSTFTFVLPTTSAAPARPPVLEEIRRRVVEAMPAGPIAGHILVVDDEANIRELLIQELTEAGYRVSEAASGVEGLQKARQQSPDLVILDLMIPDISGFDIISALRGDPTTARIPVLIVSVLEDRQKGLRLGADEYLTKPLNAETVLATVERLLARAARGEGHKKVLVVDEDSSAVETITRVLREKGYEVVEASNGQEGLAKALRERPRFIILDAMISKMNDYEILRTLKYNRETQEAYIIVMSMTASAEEIAELLTHGADHYTTPEGLSEAVKED